jgi:hypothetical protein
LRSGLRQAAQNSVASDKNRSAVTPPLKRTGAELKLFHLSPCVRELMILTRFLPWFGVCDSETYAVEHFDMPVMKAAGASLL